MPVSRPVNDSATQLPKLPKIYIVDGQMTACVNLVRAAGAAVHLCRSGEDGPGLL